MHGSLKSTKSHVELYAIAKREQYPAVIKVVKNLHLYVQRNPKGFSAWRKKFENCKVSGSAGSPLVHTVRYDLEDILTFNFKGYDFTILQSSSFG